MPASPSATELYQLWVEGDAQAAQQLFQLYSRRLASLAEKNLSDRLARRVDGDDVVQSVFRTFFHRSAQRQFEISNSSELWRLLVKITLAKTCGQARRHTSNKRDVNAESGGDADQGLYAAITHEPGPAEAAALVDQVEVAVKGLPSTYGEILGLRLEGHSRSEIAAKLNLSRQTVYRALALIEERLEKDEDESNN